jgi:hypothetical protein
MREIINLSRANTESPIRANLLLSPQFMRKSSDYMNASLT